MISTHYLLDGEYRCLGFLFGCLVLWEGGLVRGWVDQTAEVCDGRTREEERRRIVAYRRLKEKGGTGQSSEITEEKKKHHSTALCSRAAPEILSVSARIGLTADLF